MNLPFYIARRYLFSKKSHNAINIISLISACGVMVATIALVCALSVMNGFNDLVFSMFSSLDPELRITPRTGKVFDPSAPAIQQLRNLPCIYASGEVLQDNALVKYNDRQVVATIKGVDDNYPLIVPIDSILVDGRFILADEVTSYATLGIGLAGALGINVGFTSPLEFYAPQRNANVNPANPIAALNVEYSYITAVFRTNQPTYDDSFLFLPLPIARSLFNYDSEASALELKLAPGARLASVKKEIKTLLGSDYIVSDRYEQQQVYYKMMQTEKWMIFLILCFILLIALFNLTGSLSMLMIEKRTDIVALHNMGADENLTRRIFVFEGWLISGLGAITGVVVGLLLCLLQQTFGLLKMGDAGAFVVDNYPVKVEPTDIALILLTVAAVGFLSAWYPVYRMHPGRRATFFPPV